MQVWTKEFCSLIHIIVVYFSMRITQFFFFIILVTFRPCLVTIPQYNHTSIRAARVAIAWIIYNTIIVIFHDKTLENPHTMQILYELLFIRFPESNTDFKQYVSSGRDPLFGWLPLTTYLFDGRITNVPAACICEVQTDLPLLVTFLSFLWVHRPKITSLKFVLLSTNVSVSRTALRHKHFFAIDGRKNLNKSFLAKYQCLYVAKPHIKTMKFDRYSTLKSRILKISRYSMAN